MKRLTSNIEGLSARQLAQRCIGAEELSNGRERKLALGDDILMSVSSPARYVGGEVNSVMKTLTPGMVRFAMCFPDVYEIGMSHLGIQILYDMFNRYDDVWCERVYSPWLDLDKIMREKKIPRSVPDCSCRVRRQSRSDLLRYGLLQAAESRTNPAPAGRLYNTFRTAA